MPVSAPNNNLTHEKLEISWIENGIIRIHFKGKHQIAPSDQQEMIELQKKFTRGEPHCAIFTTDPSVTFSIEARENAVTLETKTNAIANATIVKNIFFMTMAGIYSSFYKMKKPYKVFYSEAAAVKWLRKFL